MPTWRYLSTSLQICGQALLDLVARRDERLVVQRAELGRQRQRLTIDLAVRPVRGSAFSSTIADGTICSGRIVMR